MRTYYEILNVPPSSAKLVIRAAYRARMAKYHPDKLRTDPAEAERMSKLINEAYRVLADPRRRAAYDASIGLQRTWRTRQVTRPSQRPTSLARVTPGEHLGNLRDIPIAGASLRRRGPRGIKAVVLSLTTVGVAFIVFDPPERIVGSQIAGFADLVRSYPVPTHLSVRSAGDLNDSPIGDRAATLKGTKSAELSCADKMSNGAASSAACLPVNEAVDDKAEPDLSSLAREDRQTVQLACLVQRRRGPTGYNRCLADQAADAGFEPYPELTSASAHHRQAVELACIGSRLDGPARYNRCLRLQLGRVLRH